MSKIGCLIPDQETSELIQATLNLANFSIKVFESESELISQLSTTSELDLIIVEHGLPEVNGLEIQDKIGEIAPTMRVAVLSADRSLETVMTAIKSGAVAYFRTPIDANSFVDEVKEALKRVPTRMTSVSADTLLKFMCKPTGNGFHTALIEAHKDDKSNGWLVKFDVDSPDGTVSEIVVDLPSYTVELAKAISDCETVPGNERFWAAMAEEALASHISSGEKLPDNGRLIVDQIDQDLKKWLDGVLTVK